MIIDKLTEIADAATSVAAAAGTVLVGSQIDLGAAGIDLGGVMPVYLVISVDTQIITGGSAGTIQFAVVSDDSATIHATTRSVHALTKEFVTDDAALAELTQGAFVVIPLPSSSVEQYERYLGLQAIIGTTTTTAGAISAYLTLTPPNVKLNGYADASN
jgi:hypothetical protein